MNLKERLSSTENLLRSIRSGEAFSSLRAPKEKTSKAAPRAAKGAASASSSPSPPASSPLSRSAPAASPAQPRFWNRQLSLGGGSKAPVLGVAMSAGHLSLALVSGGSLQFTTRFPFGPDQAFGQRGFPAFLRTCLESVRDKTSRAKVWAVLRSQDLDLNVLTVPKLSGAKLNAAVYWTQQKEKKFAEGEYVLDYLVLGPTRDAREPRLDVLTCLARRVDVDRLRDAFREAGWPLEGITTTPSAMQRLYRLPGAPKGFSLAANIHVESDFSIIGLYGENGLRFSRFIRSGTDSMAEALAEHFQELSRPMAAKSADLELPPPGAAKAPADKGAAVLQPLDPVQAKALLRHELLRAPAPAGLSPGHLLGEAKTLEVIAPALDRLAKQVERTLEYYATSQQLRCDVVHFSGSVFGSVDLMQNLAGLLGYPHAAFDVVGMLSVKPGVVSPADRMSLTPALAAGLSVSDRGINLLRNYKQRSAEQARRAVTRGLILGLALGLVLIGAAGYLIEHNVAEQRRGLALAQQRLQAMGPLIDESTLTLSVAQFKARQEAMRQAGGRFTAPAVLAELTRRTPASVKILNLTLDVGVPAAAQANPAPAGKSAVAQPTDLLTIEGIITGAKADFEPTLSRFILELQASPLFDLPVVHQTGLKETGADGQVLHFVLHTGVK